jgi:hypothetical protein
MNMGSTSLRFQQAGQQYSTSQFADHKTSHNHTNPGYLTKPQDFDFRKLHFQRTLLSKIALGHDFWLKTNMKIGFFETFKTGILQKCSI